MKRLSLLVSLSLAACLLLVGCWYDYEWRQKLTVVVETPDGVKSGSAVSRIGITESDGPLTLPEARGAHSSIKGEAVVVEVLPGKNLFALLKGDAAMDTAHLTQIFVNHPDFKPVGSYQGASLENLWPLRKKIGTRMEVPSKDYPLLVTFTDIDDPKSIQKVDPTNLAVTFGPGVRLKSITLEITDEPVTEGEVEEVLGWLGPLKGGYLHGGFTSRDAPLGLSGLDFERN